MSSRSRRRAGLPVAEGVLAVALGVAPSLHAQPLADAGLHIDYLAPAACPSEAELAESLRSRLHEDRDRATPNLSFSVEITEESGQAVAVIRFRSGGDLMVRQVVAPDCKQAVEGVTLILAVTIEAQSAPPGPAAPPPPPPAPPPAAAAPVAQAVRSPTPSPQRGVAVGAWAALVSGSAPTLAPGVAIGSVLSLRPPWPQVRLATSAYDTFAVQRAGGTVRFQQALGAVGLCSRESRSWPRFQLNPCLGGEVGVTSARGLEDGSRIVEGNRVSALWLAATATLWLRLRVGRGFLEVGPELRVPALKHEYVLSRPDQTVHATPAVGWGLRAGGVLRL